MPSAPPRANRRPRVLIGAPGLASAKRREGKDMIHVISCGRRSTPRRNVLIPTVDSSFLAFDRGGLAPLWQRRWQHVPRTPTPGIDGQGLSVMHLTGLVCKEAAQEADPMMFESTIGSRSAGCILVWALVCSLVGSGLATLASMPRKSFASFP